MTEVNLKRPHGWGPWVWGGALFGGLIVLGLAAYSQRRTAPGSVVLPKVPTDKPEQPASLTTVTHTEAESTTKEVFSREALVAIHQERERRIKEFQTEYERKMKARLTDQLADSLLTDGLGALTLIAVGNLDQQGDQAKRLTMAVATLASSIKVGKKVGHDIRNFEVSQSQLVLEIGRALEMGKAENGHAVELGIGENGHAVELG